jgi:predicted transcriptional regulator
MTAAHILVRITQEGKTYEEIAKDFDNNFELVSVWIDYMIGINWMYKDGSDNKWIATDEGKKWIEKYYDIRDTTTTTTSATHKPTTSEFKRSEY